MSDDIDQPIFVTKPSLPELEELTPYLEGIWQRGILTNNGPLHQQLELELERYLGVKHVCLFNNGTNALLLALKALDLTGEVITTPFTFAATAHAIDWNGLTPVFVDISPETLNLDPAAIESAITEKTTAILPVHCYGRPCDVSSIKEIADKYSLKVIYDAAHAFAVNDEHGSILNHGDLSILSFHATKVFNTIEGGAIICHTQAMKDKINALKNFGITDENTINAIGMNGKLNELQAAFGLLQLKHAKGNIDKRIQIDRLYRERLEGITGIQTFNTHEASSQDNGAYFPILVNDAYPMSRDELYEHLKLHNVFARKYFYPLLSNLPIYEHLDSSDKRKLPVSNSIAQNILCLPIYADLEQQQVERITHLIKGQL